MHRFLKILLGAAALLLLTAAPAFAITVTGLGATQFPSSVVTNTSAITADVAAGDTVVVLVLTNGNVSINSVTDSKGQTYTCETQFIVNGTPHARLCYKLNSAAMTVAGSDYISTTLNSVGAGSIVGAVVHGVNLHDVYNVGAQGASTANTPISTAGTVPSISPAAASEVVFGVFELTASAVMTSANDAGYTGTIASGEVAASGFSYYRFDYKINSVQATTTYAPQVSLTGRPYIAAEDSFYNVQQGDHNLLMTGVGH